MLFLGKYYIKYISMWCEQGGCGHYRDGTETFFPEDVIIPELAPVDQCVLDSSRPIDRIQVTPMTRESFFDGYEGDEDISVFENKEDFLSSTFFSKNYDAWELDLEWKWMWDICNTEQEKITSETGQVLMLRPNIPSQSSIPAANLQRMLIALGYLDFDYSDPLLSYDSSWTRETAIIYLGALWQAEHTAIRQFQVNNNLEPTWIISTEEKDILYSLMFDNFHSSLWNIEYLQR